MNRRAIFLTAMDRPDYLKRTLDSWLLVPELHDWHVVFRIEPSSIQTTIVRMIKDFAIEAGLKGFEIVLNQELLGVLHHPWVGFEELFLDYEFVVRTEDDLMVSTDVLRFFEWADDAYALDPAVGAVNAFTDASRGAPGAGTEIVGVFKPWVWGTWRHMWASLIGPTWDHDYTTGEGDRRGWDWNLHLRVFPEHNLKVLRPRCSRVKNIGEWGVHGTPENLLRAPSFVQVRQPVEFERPVRDAAPRAV